ncbi:MAG: hypothetical protein RL076_229 [Chloroflexota bacterium]
MNVCSVLLLYNRFAMQNASSYRTTVVVWLVVVICAALGTLWVLHARPLVTVTHRATDSTIHTVFPYINTIEYENDDPTGRAFRWLPDSGELRIADGSLRDVVVRIHAHTGRPPTIPTQLELRVAGRPVLTTSLAPGWRTLHILVPYAPWHDAYAQVAYRVSGEVPNDRRLLGLAVDRVDVASTRLAPHILAQWVFSLMLLGVVVLVSLRWPWAWWLVALAIIVTWVLQWYMPTTWALVVPQDWTAAGWLLWGCALWAITPYRRALLTPPWLVLLLLGALWLLRTEWLVFGALLLIVAWYGSRLVAQPDTPWSHGWVLGLLGGAVVVAAVLRLPMLNEFPVGMFRDEARHGGLAQLILARQYMVYSPFANLPAGYFYLSALPIGWFGPSAFAIRSSAALMGVLTIPIAYWALVQWWGQRTALLTSVVLSTLLWHMGMSRIGFPASAGPLLTLVAVGLLWRVLANPTSWSALVAALGAGIATGAMMHMYHSSRLMPLVVLGVIGASWYQQRWRWQSRALVLLAWGGMAVAVAAPILWYAITEPYNYMKRIDSTSLSALALREGVPFGVAVVRNLVAYLGALFVAGDGNARHFYMGMPQLTIVEGSAMLVALSLLWWRRDAASVWLAWYAGVATLPGVLSVDAPHALRTVESVVPIAVAVAYGLGQLIAYLQPRWQPRVVLLIMLVTTVWSGATYVQWQRDDRAYAEFDGQITRAVTYVQQYNQYARQHDAQWYILDEWLDGDVGVYLLRGMQVGRVSADYRTPAVAATQLLLLPTPVVVPAEAIRLPLPAMLATRDDLALWCIGTCDNVDWLR